MGKFEVWISLLALLFASLLRTSPIESSWLSNNYSKIVPDQYLTIQEAINNAAEGDTIFVRNGIYYEHVVVNKSISLVGENARTTIIDGNSTGTVVYIVSDYVNTTGFTVQKSGNVQLDAGICLNNSAHCVVSSNLLIDSGFCGISLLYSHQNMIIDNNVTRSSWGGIHLLASNNNTVSRNIVDDTFGAISGHVSSNYNNITYNVISNSTHGMFFHASSYNNICGNNISSIAVEGIWLQDQVNYNVVAENHVINSTIAIRVQGPNYNNTLSKNVITGAEYGIKIESNARYTRITGNTIIDNRAGNDSWSAGIRLDSGRNSEINLNVISGNLYGILLYSSSPYVSVIANNIANNEYGLRVASGGSNYVNVSDNIVMNNQGYGIGLTGFGGASNYAIISRNLIVNNSDGIALGQYSNYNTIIQNNISQNGYGFYIEYSGQNTIWGNSILNNGQQVYVSTGSANNWDGDYPTGGNYWSDYAGADADGDGIGELPYAINEENVDRYPLVKAFVPLVGDINHDRCINGADAVMLGSSFGIREGHPDWNPNADLNNDSYVNAKDAVILGSNFGKTY